ncbi:sodium-dependent transporter [Catenovulum sp. SM1970]|uniref:sodium-dependent transporter n=1 Tax=Marinifaba aquimaris TaxID=2741323 RepID=UPI001572A2DB|nr:sodium-dependent transporter [Marinifaba aquimaris]NTS76068.1 sodium-dependent transporter [Marinifaba aquimaris]
MSSNKASVHGQWSSRLAYILAATGAAVGLGNIWKFPYIVGENGGGAFVLVYLVCILLIGIPVMMAEVMIGKRGRKSPSNAVRALIAEAKAKPFWRLTAWMGVTAGFLILSFYAVIAGWAFAYIFKAGSGEFVGKDAAQIGEMFGNFISNPHELMFWSFLILAMTGVVVAKGVQKGIEKAVGYAMPAMFILLIVIAIYAAKYGDFAQAFNFMFAPDFSKLTINGVLEALGHAFFTLSLASGVMMMYGAYLPKETSIFKSSIWIAIADTVVALIAGLAIFPIVFGNNMEAGAGPGLIFQTLPIAFGQMPMGILFGTVFFVMLVFAAFTSAIALIESSVAWLVERYSFRRWQAAMISTTVLWLLGVGTIYSFTEASWTQFTIFPEQKTFFDNLDYLTSKLLLPLGGLMIAVFVGWVVDKKVAKEEIDLNEKAFKLWHFVLSYVAPIAIIYVFLHLIGLA